MKLYHLFGEHKGRITDVADPGVARRMLVLNHARVPTVDDVAGEDVVHVEPATEKAEPAKKSRRGRK